MELYPDITLLRSSWTKYDAVKVIEITMAGEIAVYKDNGGIDEPSLRNYLGISNIDDKLPSFWEEIYNYPDQLGLFALIASIFTHHDNIKWFANKYSQGNMQGVFQMEHGKHFTNLRSALVVSGAADSAFRRREEVPYDLSKLFEIGEVGKITKALLINRLEKIGFSAEVANRDFLSICIGFDFPRVFSLTNDQFEEWISGNGISNALYELEKNNITYEKYHRIKALKTKQWLADWDMVPNYGEKNRRKPEPYFYQFNIPAILLKRIYGVHTRRAFTDRKDEPYSQRKHSEIRSKEIREFVKGGFPWSTISDDQKDSDSFKNLQMPGWLPTSIIANILSRGSERKQKIIEDDTLIKIEAIDDNFVEIILPERLWSEKWTPLVSPIEIIDGQHRIKAFDNVQELDGDFEFPIIAFNDLDFTWQAYLFYTINIKPKRINTSLAYDLMPLLRIQDWLEQDLSGPDIYKKVRAQELTELLWRYDESPWHNRINMLGETGGLGGPVSQNAFINSLTTTFVKKWDGKLGGLFGGEMHEGLQDVIQWDKEIQASYLILIWQSIKNAIFLSRANWIVDLKTKVDDYHPAESEKDLPYAFVHKFSFFTTDQGVRPILYIFNDMSFVANDFLKLNSFVVDLDYEKFSIDEIIGAIISRLKSNTLIYEFIRAIAKEMVDGFDWRTPSAFNPLIPEEDIIRQNQNQFRGSSGYKEMRVQLLRVLAKSNVILNSGNSEFKISELATEIQNKLGY